MTNLCVDTEFDKEVDPQYLFVGEVVVGALHLGYLNTEGPHTDMVSITGIIMCTEMLSPSKQMHYTSYYPS